VELRGMPSWNEVKRTGGQCITHYEDMTFGGKENGRSWTFCDCTSQHQLTHISIQHKDNATKLLFIFGVNEDI